MNEFIFSYKHSLGTYYNLIASINDDGVVDYEYSYNSNFIYEKDKSIFVKDSLNKELSKQFIEYIKLASIEDMDEHYPRQEQVFDDAPFCNFVLLKDSDSYYVYSTTVHRANSSSKYSLFVFRPSLPWFSTKPDYQYPHP